MEIPFDGKLLNATSTGCPSAEVAYFVAYVEVHPRVQMWKFLQLFCLTYEAF